MIRVRYPWSAVERAAESRPVGYIEDILALGTVHEENGQRVAVTLTKDAYETLRAKYQPGYVPNLSPVSPAKQAPPAPTSGPGTELKKLLSMIGINATPTCSCNARAKTMDLNGAEWCRQNIDQISNWLREEATKRKLPYSDIAGKSLISLAIRRAEKAQREMPQADTSGT